MSSLIPELDEVFEFDGGQLQGIWVEFDQNQDAGQPGMITKVSRLIISDEDMQAIEKAFGLQRITIGRARTGESFEVKNPRRSGVGLTELDLHRIDGSMIERSF